MAASPRAATSARRAVRSIAESRSAQKIPAARRTASSDVAMKKAAVADAAETKPLKISKPKKTTERPATPTEDDTAPRLAAGSPQGSRKAPTKKSLVQRVYNTIDGELTKLEKQKGLTSQDRERASRALSQMVNALEKAVEMQREMTKRKTTGAGGARTKEALAHAEDLRREIAERLERLNRKRAPSRRSE
ncbi:hypothetical protein RLW55_14250 [Hyphomicrobium sp. B1]|uniref:hypothetical protein n=1 Tax=Hyphomicrobium sp. B1 TaxID=3075651 RepID=UPI003C2CEFC3